MKYVKQLYTLHGNPYDEVQMCYMRNWYVVSWGQHDSNDICTVCAQHRTDAVLQIHNIFTLIFMRMCQVTCYLEPGRSRWIGVYLRLGRGLLMGAYPELHSGLWVGSILYRVGVYG
jgi:hypothetical protein